MAPEEFVAHKIANGEAPVVCDGVGPCDNFNVGFKDKEFKDGNEMREIKFRAWDRETREMIEPQTLGDLTVNGGFPIWMGDLMEPIYQHAKDARLIPLQYTGLHDNNGKEIYEGDVVAIPGGLTGDYYEKPKVSVVEWGGGDFANVGFYLGLPECVRWRDCEVIGNIYENPELLDKPTAL